MKLSDVKPGFYWMRGAEDLELIELFRNDAGMLMARSMGSERSGMATDNLAIKLIGRIDPPVIGHRFEPVDSRYFKTLVQKARMSSESASVEGARLVMVKGVSNNEAAKQIDVSESTVSRAVQKLSHPYCSCCGQTMRLKTIDTNYYWQLLEDGHLTIVWVEVSSDRFVLYNFEGQAFNIDADMAETLLAPLYVPVIDADTGRLLNEEEFVDMADRCRMSVGSVSREAAFRVVVGNEQPSAVAKSLDLAESTVSRSVAKIRRRTCLCCGQILKG